jgi:hypothetical protein
MFVFTKRGGFLGANSNRGQIVLESLMFIVFILSLLLFLSSHIESSNKRISKHYKKIQSQEKVQNENKTYKRKF